MWPKHSWTRSTRAGVTVERGDDEKTTRVPGNDRPGDRLARSTSSSSAPSATTPHAAAERARPLVGPGTRRRIAAERLGKRRRACGRLPAGAGVVGVTYNSGLVLGPATCRAPGRAADRRSARSPRRGDDRPSRLAEALSDAGSRGDDRAEPVRPEIWKKLILNAATLPASALHRHDRGRARRTPAVTGSRRGHGARGHGRGAMRSASTSMPTSG